MFRSPLLLAALVACTPTSSPAPKDSATLGEGLDETPLPDDGTPVATAPQFFADNTLQPAVLAALQTATQRVQVAQYTIWSGSPAVDELVDAIGDAAARGVDVQVLADETSTGILDVLAALEDRGARVLLDSPERTTHNKLWIIDNTAFNGSHNLSQSALQTNREVSLQVDDPAAVAALSAWFDAVWADPEATPGHAPAGDAAVVYADDAVIEGYSSCLESADDTVMLVMYALAWDARYPGSSIDVLLNGIEAAHDRGIDVKVLLDDSEWIRDNSINTAAIERLSASGLAVRTASVSELVHAKMLVCDQRVMVSDANWSYSGLELYHGTSVAMDDPTLATAALGWAGALWDRGLDH